MGDCIKLVKCSPAVNMYCISKTDHTIKNNIEHLSLILK